MVLKSVNESQMPLPGPTGKPQPTVTQGRESVRIHHLELLKNLQDPGRGVANIVEIYRLRVLPIRTRVIHLLGRKAPAQIIETLLGFEVKSFYKRVSCPDMVTARYVKLFTELGCRTIRLPYDPTVTAGLLPELEKSLSGIIGGVRERFPHDRQLQLYVIRALFSRIRAQLKTATRNTNLPPLDTFSPK